MAPKRLLEDPPAASSAEEDSDAETQGEEEVQTRNDVVEDDEEESGEEDEDVVDDDDDDDEEEVNVDGKTPNAPNPESESASDDDADDGDSETESDDMNHSPSASDFTVKPIISQPAKKPASPAKKRAAAAEADSNPRDSKKKRAANGGGDDEDTKKGRLWGEDDEIAILEGMIEFKERGTDPFANMGAFHEFLKKSLKVDVSKNQLTDKARRLKKKYSTNAAKGEEALFAKPHELKAFELSKSIWGVEANGIAETRRPRKSSVEADSDDKKMVLALPASDMAEKNNVERKVEVNVANGGVMAEPEEPEPEEEFWIKYPNLSESLRVGSCSLKWEGLERVLSQSLPSIGSSKAKELDDEWRKLQVSEMELAVEKLDLIHEQAKLALEVMKSRME